MLVDLKFVSACPRRCIRSQGSTRESSCRQAHHPKVNIFSKDARLLLGTEAYEPSVLMQMLYGSQADMCTGEATDGLLPLGLKLSQASAVRHGRRLGPPRRDRAPDTDEGSQKPESFNSSIGTENAEKGHRQWRRRSVPHEGLAGVGMIIGLGYTKN